MTVAGLRRPSDTPATITGVSAAPNSVPPPQSLETTRAATSDDALAIISVPTERPAEACLRSELTCVEGSERAAKLICRPPGRIRSTAVLAAHDQTPIPAVEAPRSRGLAPPDRGSR